MPNALPRREVDLDELRALAHPVRQRILYHLASDGPANSTSIANVFGESTGTTSYHLRQLARFGFIEEITERATGRQRWWRLVPLDPRRATAEASMLPETEGVVERLSRIRLARDRELVDRYLRNRHRFGDWDKAAMFSSSITRLTKDELTRFTEEYVDLLNRYWRPPEKAKTGERAIAVHMSAFPWPGEIDEA
jgi:DNA-binding MarR family transcriptional regulator